MNSKRLQVLVVEDNQGDMRLVREMLIEAGQGGISTYHILPAVTLAEAIGLLQNNTIDVALLDLALPDSSGLPTLLSLLKYSPELAVIVMSGLEDESIALQAVQLGAQDYLVKNHVDSYLLSRAIQYAIERHASDLRLRHVNELLLAVRDINQLIVHERDIELLLQKACDSLVRTRQYRMAWIGKLGQPNTRLKPVARAGRGTDFVDQIAMTPDDSPTEESPSGQAVRLRAPQICADIANNPNHALWCQLALENGFLSSAAIPLQYNELLYGVINVYSGQANLFNDEEINLLTQLANDLGFALRSIDDEQLRQKAEKEALHQIQRLNTLHKIDIAITSSVNLNMTMDIILQQIISSLKVDAASLMLLNPSSKSLDHTASSGIAIEKLRRILPGNNSDLAKKAILERRIIHQNLVEDSGAHYRLLLNAGFKHYYVVPLITRGMVKGVIELFAAQESQHTDDWFHFLNALATQAAIAVDNTILFENMQRTTNELLVSYDATIEGWARALELRDHETEGHTRRVTEMTLKLAVSMGISREELVHITRGCMLHDIGKMATPDHILHKPGPLTAEEWEIMRQHPVQAYNLIKPIAYLRRAMDIPYCHHEKWDGSGYPRGLKGEEIPLMARIFAIIDVWDALSSHRPYREAWPQDKILAHLAEQSGKHFDPQVVAAFLKLLKTG